MTIDTAKLRALAEAATPGPWSVGHDDKECASTLRAQPVLATTGKPQGRPVDVIIPFGRAHSDAAFIAAANPQTVIALLDEIERLRHDLYVSQNTAQSERLDHISTLGQAGELERKLAAMTAARDEACEIADDFILGKFMSSARTRDQGAARIAELRKVGSHE